MEHNDILHTEWSSKKGEFPSKTFKKSNIYVYDGGICWNMIAF